MKILEYCMCVTLEHANKNKWEGYIVTGVRSGGLGMRL